MNQKNELYNRNLHISGLLNEEKVDIGDSKVDIENEKGHSRQKWILKRYFLKKVGFLGKNDDSYP